MKNDKNSILSRIVFGDGIADIEKLIAERYSGFKFAFEDGAVCPEYGKRNMRTLLMSKGSGGDFPRYNCVMLDINDFKLYKGIIYEPYAPNWNHEYRIEYKEEMKDGMTAFNSMEELFYVERTFLSILHDDFYKRCVDFVEQPDSDGLFKVTIADDRTGRRIVIGDKSIDAVFKTIADKYQGIRNYRRMNAVECDIVNADTKKKFDDWKLTASGLKSDFDKFYGGGIVD